MPASDALPLAAPPRGPTSPAPDPSTPQAIFETLAIVADEAVTMLPPNPTAKHKRILARLYMLVSKTADQADEALEKGEDMLTLAPLRSQRGAARSAHDRDRVMLA